MHFYVSLVFKIVIPEEIVYSVKIIPIKYVV